MRTGSGVGLIALGAILYWAVDVNLPYVDPKTLGAILMTLGVVALAVSLAVSMHGSTTSVGTGIALVLAGAVCCWGLNVHLSFVDLQGLGVVLMIAGVVAIAATLTMEVQRSRTRRVVEYRNPGHGQRAPYPAQEYRSPAHGQQAEQRSPYAAETQRLPAQPPRYPS